MTDENLTDFSLSGFVKVFIVPAITATLIGAGSTWFTAQIALAEIQKDIEAQRSQIVRIEAMVEAKTETIKTNEVARRATEVDMVDRMARLETKVDLLLQQTEGKRGR